MANIKITQLTEIVAPANEDVLPIVDVSGDITQKVQAANLPISTATQTALDAKQATLVSGTNIKTINSTSLLGSGDISIAANPAGTAGQIQFSDGSAFAADSNLYWDNTNKRLGVGTSSPSSVVEINHNPTGISNTIGLVLNNGTTGVTLKSIVFNSGNNERGYFGVNNLGGEFRWGINGGGYFPTIYSNGIEALRINTSQQVGVGSTSPTARLQVKGSGSTSATTSLLVQNSSGTELFKVRDDGNAFASQTITALGFQCSGSGSILSSVYAKINNTFLRASGQGINISEANTTPDGTAQLQVDSTTRGFLPPRMTTTQKNAISTPAAGLQLYDSTTSRPCVYTTAWESLTSSDSASPTAVYKFWSGTAAQYAALTPDANTVYFVS